MTMSNRLAVMRMGKIEQIGAPEDVYESPSTEFVAGFLGASNLLEGDVKERNREFATVLLPGGSTVTVPGHRMNGMGRSVKVGVRPEKIRIQAESQPVAGDLNSLPGKLRVSSYVGVSHQYTVEGPMGSTFTVYAQNLGGRAAPQPGERVNLTWRPEHTFVVTSSTPPADWEEER